MGTYPERTLSRYLPRTPVSRCHHKKPPSKGHRPPPTLRKDVQWRLPCSRHRTSPDLREAASHSGITESDYSPRRPTSLQNCCRRYLHLRPDRVTRGTQCQPAVVSRGIQSDNIWKNASDTETHSERCTTTTNTRRAAACTDKYVAHA